MSPFSCLEKKQQACHVLDNPSSSKEEKQQAKVILLEDSCMSCRNPLVQSLSLDDMLCENMPETKGDPS